MTKKITNFPTNIRIQYFDNTTQTNCAINRNFSTKEEFITFTKRLQKCDFCDKITDITEYQIPKK